MFTDTLTQNHTAKCGFKQVFDHSFLIVGCGFLQTHDTFVFETSHFFVSVYQWTVYWPLDEFHIFTNEGLIQYRKDCSFVAILPLLEQSYSVTFMLWFVILVLSHSLSIYTTSFLVLFQSVIIVSKSSFELYFFRKMGKLTESMPVVFIVSGWQAFLPSYCPVPHWSFANWLNLLMSGWEESFWPWASFPAYLVLMKNCFLHCEY